MSSDGVDHGDYVFEEGDLPERTPGFLRTVLLDLTFWEAHAILLGLLGLFVGPALRLGFVVPTAFFTALFIGLAFGFRRLDPADVPEFEGSGFVRAVVYVASGVGKSIAARTLGREPWYFLTVYVLLSVVSWVAYPPLA